MPLGDITLLDEDGDPIVFHPPSMPSDCAIHLEIDLMSGKSVVSPTWRKIMEVGPEVEDTQEEFLSRIHPDDLPRLIEADQHCITGKAERSRTEYRMQFGESWRWMRSDAVVVDRADDGSAIRMQ